MFNPIVKVPTIVISQTITPCLTSEQITSVLWDFVSLSVKRVVEERTRWDLLSFLSSRFDLGEIAVAVWHWQNPGYVPGWYAVLFWVPSWPLGWAIVRNIQSIHYCSVETRIILNCSGAHTCEVTHSFFGLDSSHHNCNCYHWYALGDGQRRKEGKEKEKKGREKHNTDSAEKREECDEPENEVFPDIFLMVLPTFIERYH